MKKEIGKYVAIFLGIICVILAITLICIRVSSVNAQSGTSNLTEKLSEEISFLDSNITEIMNSMNNITVIKYKVYTKEINESESSNSSSQKQNSGESEQSQEASDSGGQSSESDSSSQESGSSQDSSKNQSKENSTTVSELVPDTTLEKNSYDPDWQEISFLVERIYSTWPTINLDLQKQGIANELINSFALSLDGVVQSIKNKDKNNTLINLFNMYINIPKYSSSINDDSFKINMYNTKLNLLNAYVLVSTDDNWNNASASVTSAKSYFSGILSSDNSQEDRKNTLQKTYLIIEDLERITQINDKDIFFMGYKNVMQELETL